MVLGIAGINFAANRQEADHAETWGNMSRGLAVLGKRQVHEFENGKGRLSTAFTGQRQGLFELACRHVNKIQAARILGNEGSAVLRQGKVNWPAIEKDLRPGRCKKLVGRHE